MGYSCPILMKFSRQVFEKYSNIRFNYIPSSGSRIIPYGQPDGRTDKNDKSNSRFSEFCERG